MPDARRERFLTDGLTVRRPVVLRADAQWLKVVVRDVASGAWARSSSGPMSSERLSRGDGEGQSMNRVNAPSGTRHEFLPSGMTVATAASGFKTEGQFIAALHVSRNLNIPFAQLKAEMTGADHDSLGQAIHDLQPAANVKMAVTTARQEARADIKATTPPKPDADTDKDPR
jgi:hypothetical protein